VLATDAQLAEYAAVLIHLAATCAEPDQLDGLLDRIERVLELRRQRAEATPECVV
jgi:hypothetical protein